MVYFYLLEMLSLQCWILGSKLDRPSSHIFEDSVVLIPVFVQRKKYRLHKANVRQ